MNNTASTVKWICRLVIVLGVTLVPSAVGIITLTILGQPVPGMLIVLGVGWLGEVVDSLLVRCVVVG